MSQKLNKNLSKMDVLVLAIGSIIGWGAFVLPGNLFINYGVINTFIGLFLGAIIMIIIEKNYGFLLSKHSVAGGEYAFTFKSFERKHAFICGWFLSLAYISIVPLNATALALIAKAMFPKILEKGYIYTLAGSDIFIFEVLLAVITLIAFAYLNIKGVKMASIFQSIMILFLVGIVFYMGGFLIFSENLNKDIFYGNFHMNLINYKSILKILVIAPWAYIGFDCIPQVAEEFNFPAKKASKLAVISILVGCLIYNILNILTASVYTKEILSTGVSDWATGDAIEFLFGKIGLYSLGLALLMAIISGINGFYISSSRLLFSMGRSKILPEWFMVIDEKSRMPKNAIIFVMLVSLLGPFMGRVVLNWIVEISSLGAAVAYTYTSFSAYIQAKKEKNKSIQKFGILGGLFGIIFILLLICPTFSTSLSIQAYILLIVWISLGFVFYIKYGKEHEKMKNLELEKLILGSK